MKKDGVAKVKIESKPRRKPTKKTARPTTEKRAEAVAMRTDPPVPSPQ